MCSFFSFSSYVSIALAHAALATFSPPLFKVFRRCCSCCCCFHAWKQAHGNIPPPSPFFFILLASRLGKRACTRVLLFFFFAFSFSSVAGFPFSLLLSILVFLVSFSRSRQHTGVFFPSSCVFFEVGIVVVVVLFFDVLFFSWRQCRRAVGHEAMLWTKGHGCLDDGHGDDGGGERDAEKRAWRGVVREPGMDRMLWHLRLAFFFLTWRKGKESNYAMGTMYARAPLAFLVVCPS